MKKRALISVSDKTGVLEFAKTLVSRGFEIVSTGGTYDLLKEVGAINISEVTGFPEIMDGRVKTLHPAIHGGLLAVRENPAHMATIAEHGITPFDIVAVNLYPFKQTILKQGVTEEEAIENIDIGGPSMLRSAAKNHASVAVIVDPADYDTVCAEIAESGNTTLATRKNLAAKAFRHTAAYDALIAAYFTKEAYPEKLTLTYEIKQPMRYGENPHQSAALYATPITGETIVNAKQLHGKELSYNNIADADATLSMVREFSMPAAVAVKHQNPCGVGIGETIEEAFARANEADPVSIFGGIIALNREVNAACAELLKGIFLEIIIAPSYSEEAFAILSKKKNLRLLQVDTAVKPSGEEQKILGVDGGLLVQAKDTAHFDTATLTYPTERKPTPAELATAKFAWTCVKYVKSNGILLARDNMTVGIGPGQTNRVGAAQIALRDAGERAKGAVLASDAFFPMPDTVEIAAAAGVEVFIQPGGSVKDQDSIDLCNKLGLCMVFTGVRHFRH